MKIPLRDWLDVLPKPERILSVVFVAALVLSFGALLFTSYVSTTAQAPAFGGSLSIGFVGTPHYINPVLAPANEVDRALVKLVYPSLLRYNHEGQLIPYLAQRYAVGEDGKVYEFFLREGAVWDDGQPVTAEDVVFTIKTIQDSKVLSPLARLWEGVKVSAIDEMTVRFSLSEPYAFFLQNVTIGVLPAHIWGQVSAENFPLAEHNKEPIGAGPYRFSSFNQAQGTISEITFKSNETFFERLPYVPKITVFFYESPQDLLFAYQKGEVDVAGLPAGTPGLSDQGLSVDEQTPFFLPRYFAVFFNEVENKALEKKDVREGLARAVNRERIIASVFNNQAAIVNSPIPAVLKAYYKNDLVGYSFDPAKARELLEGAGFSEQGPLTVELTVVNDPLLNQVAQFIIENWRSVGVDVSVRSLDITELRDEALQKRNYEAFLFGQALALEPDPFSLWHSSQVEYPGLNLTSYQGSKVDNTLQELRKEFDEEKKKELFATLQGIIVEDLPAIFLYSPYHIVLSDASIRGIRTVPLSLPEDYINQITEWYTYTKRISQ